MHEFGTQASISYSFDNLFVHVCMHVCKVHGILNVLSHYEQLNGLSSSVDSFMGLQSAWYVERFFTL